MEKFNILIVEDDLMIAEMLHEMLLELGYTVNAIAHTYEMAIEKLNKKQKTDLCFVDINLESQKNGFDVAAKINSDFFIPFVFLTSYSDKKTVMEAALLQPAAYLVKPFSQADLFTTIEIIRARANSNVHLRQEKSTMIKDGTVLVKVLHDDILWLKSDNIYVEVKTAGKTYLVRNSLEKFLEDLDDTLFFRTHRSYAVNLRHVNAVNGQYLIVAGEKTPLSRKFRDEALLRFKS